MIEVSADRCTGCCLCISNCPANAISIIESKAQINPQLCQQCLLCTSICPQQAIVSKAPDKISEIRLRLSRLNGAIFGLNYRLDRLSQRI